MKHSDARTLARNLALDRDGAVSGAPAGADVAKILNDHITRLGSNDRSKVLAAVSTDFSIGQDAFSARLTPTSIMRVLSVTSSQDVLAEDTDQPAFVSWSDGRVATSQVYVQKVDLEGNAEWTANGVVVSASTSGSASLPDSATLGLSDGGCVVLYKENTGGTLSLRANRFDVNGAKAWGATGVLVSGSVSGLHQSSLRVVDDSSDGYWFAWATSANPFARHCDSTGTMSAAEVQCGTLGSTDSGIELLPDGFGGAYVSWTRTSAIYGQRVSSASALLWASAGVSIGANSTFENPLRAPVCVDAGSLVVLNYVSTTSIVMSKRDPASGAATWTTSNLDSSLISMSEESRMILNTDGGMLGLWLDQQSVNDVARIRRVNSDGAVQWGSAVSFYSRAKNVNFEEFRSVSDGSGNVIVLIRSTDVTTLVALKVSKVDGSVVWGPVTVATVADIDEPGYYLVSDGSGGAVVFFREDAAADVVRAVRVTTAGVVSWTTVLNSAISGARFPANGSLTTRIITSGSDADTGPPVEIVLPADIYHMRSKSVAPGTPSAVAFTRLGGDGNRLRAICHPPSDGTTHFAIHCYLNPPEFTTSVIDDNEVMDATQARQYEVVRETALDLAIILRRPDSVYDAIAARVPQTGELAENLMARDMATGAPATEPK